MNPCGVEAGTVRARSPYEPRFQTSPCGFRMMAAAGDRFAMTLTFERPLTEEKVAEHCRAIADHLVESDN